MNARFLNGTPVFGVAVVPAPDVASCVKLVSM